MNSQPHSVGLRIQRLTKTFTVHRVERTVIGLRDVNLHLSAGEHVTLTGPSGSGKSTLLRCIYGTYRPTQGQIVLTGASGQDHELTNTSPQQLDALRRRFLGYVSQFLSVQPRRSARQIVSAAARNSGMDDRDAETATRELLGRLVLEERVWDLPVSLLSGGEKQRINLARTFIAPPPLLLLDEPTASLDPANALQVMTHVERLRAAGTTVLSVLHDLELAERFATRSVALGRPTAPTENHQSEVCR
ncbi:ATP-binding cassette domain-containing protein [Nocardia sp. NPDC059239]|uniref:ATP-binding cassette domain-containing protein n=1 Tax=Nocardia sp. NPDC059239 TaxID=3346785 RepID=UPI0036BFBA56